MDEDFRVMESWLGGKDAVEIHNEKSVPLSVDEFILWMIKSHTNAKFHFWVEEYGFLMYTTNNKLYVEVESQSMLPAGKNADFKHLKFRRYVDDDADFLRKVKNIKFLYWDRYENYTETLVVGEKIRRFFDPSLKKNYDVLDPQYKITILHEEAVARFIEMIDNMPDLYNLSTPLYYIKGLYHDKKLLDSSKKSGDSGQFTFQVKYKKLSQDDLSAILTRNADIEKSIKSILDPYLDLITYMIIIKHVAFTYVISADFFGKTKAVIDIKLYLEFISADDYYNTIGYYKNLLKNVCTNKHFKFSDVEKMAAELGVEIEGFTDDEICNILKERVDNLNWSDFGSNQ